MRSKRFLVNIQYLGFRFHGVQKLPGLPNVQERIESTLSKTFSNSQFKTRFSSRTDAMVSALDSYALLMFVDEVELTFVEDSLKKLPPDIKMLEIKPVEDNFTILKSVKNKTYRYYFSFNTESHPFCAPFMTIINEDLDIELMKKGCKLFIGEHNYEHYVYKPKAGTTFNREIYSADIFENIDLSANFFPDQSWYFEVKSNGFMRGQVRLMMGALLGLVKMKLL